MLFEVRGLSKRFGAFPALTDVSFHVYQGEILGLLGPNGAGKTTLFECLAGLLPYESGELLCNRAPLRSQASSLLFYIPDGITPWPAQSLRWILDFSIGFLGGRPDLLNQVVQQLDLSELLRKPLGTLSKGQRKRALLAIGLVSHQPALLIDEPFDGLDLRQARDIAAVLRAHASLGRTLFLSIHQISDAARLCDRFIFLNLGKVVGQGSLSELALLASSPTTISNLEEIFLALT